MLDFFFFFFLEIVVYFPLSILGGFLLFKAVKRKNVLQITIFSMCFIYTTYRIISHIPSYISFVKEDRLIRKYEHMKAGDQVIVDGVIVFQNNFLYELQDSLLKWEQDSVLKSQRHIHLSVHTYKENNSVLPIVLSSRMFDSLKIYLNYLQQSKDSVSYRIKANIMKLEQGDFKLLDLIKIDSVHKAPALVY